MNVPLPVAGITKHGPADSSRAVLVLILIFLAVRLVLSALLPLIADEAYAVVVSRIPSLSYFDHPPLGFDFARLSAWLFGSETNFIVRLPHVILGSLSAWLLFLITRRAFGAQAGFWAVAWYSVAPFFFVSAGHFAVPDGPLNFFLLLTLWLVLPQLIEDQAPAAGRWALAGLALGLALLSKYTAVLFGVAAFIVLLSTPRGRRALSSPGPWVAIAIALICLTPVLLWNYQNGWASFGFQSGRAIGSAFNPLNFLVVQLGQAGFLLPWVWAIAVFLVVRGLFGPGQLAQRLFAILVIVPVLLFDVVAMFGREVLPHWAMPGFLFAFPLVGLWCAQISKRLPRLVSWAFAGSAAFVLALAAIVVIQAQTGAVTRALALPPKADFDWTFLDWTALHDDFARRGIVSGDSAYLVPASWNIAAKAGYALGPSVPVAPPLTEPRHFAFANDHRLSDRAEGYATIAAWPEDTNQAVIELKALIGETYEIAGDSWIVPQSRRGHTVFNIVVQPVRRR